MPHQLEGPRAAAATHICTAGFILSFFYLRVWRVLNFLLRAALDAKLHA